MLVCHCNVVTDREICAAISDGAHDLLAIADACGAGADCLGCMPTVEQLLIDAGLAVSAPNRLRSIQAGGRIPGIASVA